MEIPCLRKLEFIIAMAVTDVGSGTAWKLALNEVEMMK